MDKSRMIQVIKTISKLFLDLFMSFLAGGVGLYLPAFLFLGYEWIIPGGHYTTDTVFAVSMTSSLVCFFGTLAWLWGKR